MYFYRDTAGAANFAIMPIFCAISKRYILLYFRKRSENIAHKKTKMKDYYDQNKNHHGYDETTTKC